MYIDREDTGKEKTPSERERCWHVETSGQSCYQMQIDTHIKRWGPHSTQLIDTVT